MERRLRPGLTDYGPIDESRESPLLEPGRDMSRRPSPGGPPPGPPPTWRPLAGASANNRGMAVPVVLPTLLGGPSQKVPSIVQSPLDRGFDGELISVRLGMFLPQELTDVAGAGGPYTAVPIDVVALLDFGVGGVSYQAEVDWNQGTVFGVSSSFMRVSARVGEIPAIAFPDITIVLQASLAYGDSANTGISSPARRTILMGPRVGATPTPTSIGAGASLSIPIPVWAIGVTIVDGGGLVGTNPVAPDYTIELTDVLGASVATYKSVSRTNVANQIEGQFPVPVRARFLTLTNNLPIALKNPQAIFNLSL